MSSGLYSGVSGLALGVGLYKGVGGLWGGASGLIDGFGGFSPATLFAAGEQGGWYDSSDLSTMFQDSAGTTPVTATGQTVGLLLDKSQGLVLGPELLALGAIGLVGTATAASYSTSSGVGSVTRVDASNQSFVRWSGLTTGSFYRIVITNTSANGINVRAGNEGAAFIAVVPAGQAVTMYGVPGSNLITITSGGGTATFTLTSILQVAGNHLTQATAASRPIYGIEPFGGRRNLLTFTEQFDNAAWTKNASSVTANSSTAPDGTTTADTLTATAGTGVIPRVADISIITATSTAYTASMYVKAGTYTFFQIYLNNQAAEWANFTLTGAGTATANGTSTATITALGDGWYRCSMTYTAGGIDRRLFFMLAASGTATRAQSWNPGGTETLFIWGAQLEVGSLATPYQRVTDQWNVTEAGVPSVSYVQYDGTDDWFISPTITPGVDKAQVFAGVRKLSDAAVGVLAETSAAGGVGSVSVLAPRTSTISYGYASRGSLTAEANTTAGAFPAPITNVLTGIGDIAADVATLRVNGTQVATSATDQGTGNYLAYPLYVGRRGGTSLPFNGRLYQMIVRFGANLDASTIAATEAFVETKTGAIPPLNATLNLDFLANAYEAGI